MQRRNDILRQSNIQTGPRLKPFQQSPLPPNAAGWTVLALTLAAVSCSWGLLGVGSASRDALIVTRTPWPTFTPADTLTPTAVTAAQASVASTSALTPTLAFASQATSPPATDTLIPATALPADTPTPAMGPTATSTPVPMPTPTPTAVPVPTETPPPTSTPTLVATPTVEPSDWSFASVRVVPDQFEDSLLLYGDIINNSGSWQALNFVTGTFYDDQGQVIADEESTYDYWPIDIIPPGGRLPFELTVEGIQNAAQYRLSVEADPSSETSRQDFEFLDLNSGLDRGDYCVTGETRNPGDELYEYLLVVAVLYDNEEGIINFDSYDEPSPEDLMGDQTLPFAVCVDPLSQQVARYELRAWGQ